MSMAALRWLAATQLVFAMLLVGLGTRMFSMAGIGQLLFLSTPLLIVGALMCLSGIREAPWTIRIAEFVSLATVTWGASELKWWMAECWFEEALWQTGWWERLAMSTAEYSIGVVLPLLIVGYKRLPPQSHYVPGQLR